MKLVKVILVLGAFWLFVQVLIVTAKSNLAHQARTDPLSTMPATAKTSTPQWQYADKYEHRFYSPEEFRKLMAEKHWTVPDPEPLVEATVYDSDGKPVGGVVGYGKSPKDDLPVDGSLEFSYRKK